MVFKVGDNVKTKSDGEYGRVTAVDEDTITYRTPWRQTKTAQASELEASGFMGFVASESPDIMELLANTISFAAINKISGKGLMSKENMRFAVEDAAYEFLLKGWVRPTVDGWVGVTPLSGADMEAWFSSQDIKDAIVKGIPIAALDAVYNLWQKGKFGPVSALMFSLKAVAAMTIANVAQRKIQTKGSSYSPQ